LFDFSACKRSTSAYFIDQFSYYAGPAGLMRSAHSPGCVSMEILIEQNKIIKMNVIPVDGKIVIYRSLPVLIFTEGKEQAFLYFISYLV
jgi:hypothetical protein